MSNQLKQRLIQCPYCWEVIEVLIEPSDEEQRYVEDCQVCCKPIEFHVFTCPDGEVMVDVKTDDE